MKNRHRIYALLTLSIGVSSTAFGQFSWRPDLDTTTNPDIGDNTATDYEYQPSVPDQEEMNTQFDQANYPSNNYYPELQMPSQGPHDISTPPNQYSCSASVHNYGRAYVESFQTGPSLNSKCGFQQLLNFNLIDKFSLSGLINGSFCGFARSIVNPAIQQVNAEINRINTYIPSNAELNVNGEWELTDTGFVADLSWNLNDSSDYFSAKNDQQSWTYGYQPNTPNQNFQMNPDDPTQDLYQMCLAYPEHPMCIEIVVGGQQPVQPATPPPVEHNTDNEYDWGSSDPTGPATIPDTFNTPPGSNQSPGAGSASGGQQSGQSSNTDSGPTENASGQQGSTVSDNGSINWGDVFSNFFNEP